MKLRFITIYMCFGFILSINAQREDILCKEYLEYLKQGLEVFNNSGLSFNVAPQVGGLFIENFVESNTQNFYKTHFRDYDFGLRIVTGFPLLEKLNFKVLYSFGMLEFNRNDKSRIYGPITKAVLKINF